MNGRTVGVRNGPRHTDRTDNLRFGTIRELEPVVRIGPQILRLYFERPVDIVGSERITSVERVSRKIGVIEDLEGYANGDALVRRGT